MYRIKNKTKIRNNQSQRFARLAQSGLEIFHAQDLANLWQIDNANTLYTTLKRYAQGGLLYRIYKGLYSLKELTELDPFLLGLKALHTFAYVSTETILARQGAILQDISYITMISNRVRKFKIGGHEYLSRKLPDEFLYNPAAIDERDGINYAAPERAAADLLYFNRQAYFDNPRAIDWDEVRRIQREVGYL